MADQVEKIATQNTRDAAGGEVTTTAVTTESADAKVNKTAEIIWFVFGVLIAFLLVRFTLSLLGANSQNGFANFIYGITGPFVTPFRGLLQQGEFQAGVSRLEFETLVAVVAYLLLGWGVTMAIRLGKKNPEA